MDGSTVNTTVRIIKDGEKNYTTAKLIKKNAITNQQDMSTGALNATIYPLMMIAIVRWGGTSCGQIKIAQLGNQYPSVNYLFSYLTLFGGNINT